MGLFGPWKEVTKNQQPWCRVRQMFNGSS